MADNRYGSSGVNVASIREFVTGVQARSEEQTKAGAAALATGVLTAAAITWYQNRRGKR